MLDTITSGERFQLTRFREDHSVPLKPNIFQNKVMRSLATTFVRNYKSQTNFTLQLDDTAYAKYLYEVFDYSPEQPIGGSEIDLRLSDAAQKILELTSYDDKAK